MEEMRREMGEKTGDGIASGDAGHEVPQLVIMGEGPIGHASGGNMMGRERLEWTCVLCRT